MSHKRLLMEIDPRRVRRWHLWLLQELRRRIPGCRVSVRRREGPLPPPAAEALLSLERVLFGRESALDGITFDDLAGIEAFSPAESDVILDLTGGPVETTPPAESETLRLHLLFDGVPGETGVLLAILRQRCPLVTLTAADTHIALGRPALQGGRVMRRAANSILARTVRLLADRLARPDPFPKHATTTAPSPPPENAIRAWPLLNMLAGEVARRAQKKIRRLLGANPPRWRTGWRLLNDTTPLWRDGRYDPADWSFLPDDGRRFFADPFPFVHGKDIWLFLEEYPFATGKGLISACRIDAGGKLLQPPIPVLEPEVHASYPLVFRHDGRIWMLPETSKAGELRLYVCEDFPRRWRLHAVLIDAPISDATLFHDGSRWWIMATDTAPPASSWDSLLLYHAERLEGPWTPHPHNPVLVDCASARPGGLVWRDGARWLRPAQICEHGYGLDLAICAMQPPHPDEPFAQRILRRVANIRGGPSVHTYNRAGGLEFIDTYQFSPV